MRKQVLNAQRHSITLNPIKIYLKQIAAITLKSAIDIGDTD